MNYQALASKYQREKRKRLVLGNVHLVLWYYNNVVHWWLLAMPPDSGRHPIHQTDNLKNALLKDQRIEIDGLELVRAPKVGTDSVEWTWRMTDQKCRDWHERIVQAVRSRSHHQMDRVLYLLWSCPGFNGIRVQIGKLAVIYRAETKRAGLKDAPMPPKRLYYLRRILHHGITVKQLLAQTKIAA